MKRAIKNSRREFIRKSTLAAAGTVALTSVDWTKVLANEASKKNPSLPNPEPGSIHHIPLEIIGLTSIPAIPFVIEGIANTLFLLGARSYEVLQAKYGLNKTFTINGQSATGFSFMFGKNGPSDIASKDREALLQLFSTSDIETIIADIKELLLKSNRSSISLSDDPLTKYSLEDPKQFSLSWTTFYNIFQKASANLLSTWSSTLTDVQSATKEFWPTISRYGLAYNLLFLKKVNHQLLNDLKQMLGNEVANHYDLRQLAIDGNLYAIDLTLFNALDVNKVEGVPRFTPSSFILLEQDPSTKELTPISIVVTGKNGLGAQTFVRGLAADGAWLYALQAAKVSATVYGIWIGHVYHWHIVTAAMVMTMYNNIPNTHPLFPMLDKSSQYLIEFNEVLLLLWRSIAPPSSVTSGLQLLELLDSFATGRKFFDDDPLSTLNNQGLKQEDFTTDNDNPWNQYPIVGELLEIWNSTSTYVTSIVNTLYATDADVAGDSKLQAWMADAANPEEGNIQGLPTMNNKTALINVLTSYHYRITAHGCSRLIDSANPSLTFVANFPPCLQNAVIPSPSSNISTGDLLKYLPNTGTIGEMIAFYYIFAFSAPYDSFIPIEGVNANLPYANGPTDPKNIALIQYRNEIMSFIKKFTARAQQYPFPADEPQYQQWPTNIET
ncbi:MAG: lipoxygenase family protein [Chitinophagales bacterium]